ncbi:MAG TPA: chromate transporter [Polyangiaceae bacterium]|jgi:chromate transporter|nr:chromate transporter [Polyangiaceae bacterium]
MTRFGLLSSCFWISLLSFGGIYGAFPELQRVFVTQHGVLTTEQLIDAIVVAQMVPGPGMVACTMIGQRIGGLPGALTAFVGTYAAPVLLISGIAGLFDRYRSLVWVRRAEVALRPLVVGFMGAAAVTILLQQMHGHPWATVAVAAGASWLHARRVLSPLPLMAAAGFTCWVVFATLSSH